MNKYGIDIKIKTNPLGFIYGKGVSGPIPEIRCLDDIRSSLSDPDATGPNELYCIAMDVYRNQDLDILKKLNLLFGVVTYTKGTIGEEPIRSQGHKHFISPSCNASTCEVYEIFEGEAYIYMQQYGGNNAGKCFVVHAKAGDVVVVPPRWIHATINANINTNMSFGAWCVRDYGFDYDDVRKHQGIAYFPKVRSQKIVWDKNPNYLSSELIIKEARTYPELKIEQGIPIYQQFILDNNKFLFVSNPQLMNLVWEDMENEN